MRKILATALLATIVSPVYAQEQSKAIIDLNRDWFTMIGTQEHVAASVNALITEAKALRAERDVLKARVEALEKEKAEKEKAPK